jgi:hypothetical protein
MGMSAISFFVIPQRSGGICVSNGGYSYRGNAPGNEERLLRGD